MFSHPWLLFEYSTLACLREHCAANALQNTHFIDALKNLANNTNSTYHRFRRTFQGHGTSIWDESLFGAWGSIIHSLIPNLSTIKSILDHLMEITGADEIILFERQTFLKVTSVQSELGEENPYEDRFERLSHIIRAFKSSISCVSLPNRFPFKMSLSPQRSSPMKITPSLSHQPSFSCLIHLSYLPAYKSNNPGRSRIRPLPPKHSSNSTSKLHASTSSSRS